MRVHLTLYSSRIAHTLAILAFTSAQKHRSQNCLPLPVCKLPSSPWLRTDMMLSQKPAFASAVRGLRSGLPACLPAAAGTQRRVVVRFRDEQKSDIERLEQQLTNDAQTPTDAANKFSSEQVEQVGCACQLSCSSWHWCPCCLCHLMFMSAVSSCSRFVKCRPTYCPLSVSA